MLRGPTTPWHGMQSLPTSPWRSCDSQRNIGHAGWLSAQGARPVDLQPRSFTRCVRQASIHKPLSACSLARSFLGTFLSGGARSIFLLSSFIREVPENSRQRRGDRRDVNQRACSSQVGLVRVSRLPASVGARDFGWARARGSCAVTGVPGRCGLSIRRRTGASGRAQAGQAQFGARLGRAQKLPKATRGDSDGREGPKRPG
jgi:hypothetical protein